MSVHRDAVVVHNLQTWLEDLRTAGAASVTHLERGLEGEVVSLRNSGSRNEVHSVTSPAVLSRGLRQGLRQAPPAPVAHSRRRHTRTCK